MRNVKLMKSLIIFLLTIIWLSGISQSKNDSLKISLFFPKVEVAGSKDFYLNVVYQNKTKSSVEIYEYLSEGNMGDRFDNIFIEMQRLQGGEFKDYTMRYYQNPLLSRMDDSLRHYDLPKKKLPALSSDTLSLNILNIAGSFTADKYRFKAHLRVKTIKNDTPYNDPNLETSPPEDQIEYVESKWIYFTVKKDIDTKRNE